MNARRVNTGTYTYVEFDDPGFTGPVYTYRFAITYRITATGTPHVAERRFDAPTREDAQKIVTERFATAHGDRVEIVSVHGM